MENLKYSKCGCGMINCEPRNYGVNKEYCNFCGRQLTSWFIKERYSPWWKFWKESWIYLYEGYSEEQNLWYSCKLPKELWRF